MATFNLSYSQLEAHWASFLAVNTIVATLTSPGQIVQKAQIAAARETLAHGAEYTRGLSLWQALGAEYTPLAQGLALPVPVPASVLNTAQTRINTIKAAIGDLNTLLRPTALPQVNFNQIMQGATAFPSPGFLAYVMTFNREAPPSGLTVNNFSTVLAQQSADWTTYAQALKTAYPTGQGGAIDAFNRQAAISLQASTGLTQFTGFSTTLPLQGVWNTMAVWPAIATTGSLISNGPASPTGQSYNILRTLLNTAIQTLDTLLAAFAEQGYQNVRVILARQNDSLPNIAARELGNYTRWQEIAVLNAIPPPYTVSAGQQLFMPPSTNANGTVPPNYLTNYLGVDLYYGPLNQPMLPWTGDFTTISGYANLEISLARTVLTTQGTLIYHPTYGSRVPPEVGNIQTANTAAHIGAFANSAILGDPRVNKILTWTITMQPNSEIAYTADVLPNGLGSTSTRLNLVLG